jgi:putative ATP-dependent endonuclease of OLD family
VIWIEGPSDRNYINHFISLFTSELIEGRDYIFLCYSQLQRLNVDIEIIEEGLTNVLQINHNAIIIMDSDRNSEESEIAKLKRDIVSKCEENNGLGWITDGKEIENYLPNIAIKMMCKDIRKVDIEVDIKPFDEVGV